MRDHTRGFTRPRTLRLTDEADARLDTLADELRTDRAKIQRALILEGIGLADPITAATAQLVRERAASLVA